MRHTNQNEIKGIHRLPLLGALAIVLLTVVLVLVSVLGGIEPVGTKSASSVEERDLYFQDHKNGQVLVFDANSKEEIGKFQKGEGAFVRISMRSMMRQRKLKEVDLKKPFKLVRFSDGNIKIVDPYSNEFIRINAFGPIAIKSFGQFLSTNHLEKGAKG